MAVVRNGREQLANAIASQIDTHALYGGVVPEIASRMHVEAIDPLLDRLADTGDDRAYKFPHPHTQGKYDFSFSGLKTAVINQAHNLRQQGVEINAANFAASFRRSVVDLLVDKTVAAAKDTGAKRLAVAGGVAANSLLRSELQRRGEKAGMRVFIPPKNLCTDNAVMIGSAAFYRLMAGEVAGLELNAVPALRMIQSNRKQ